MVRRVKASFLFAVCPLCGFCQVVGSVPPQSPRKIAVAFTIGGVVAFGGILGGFALGQDLGIFLLSAAGCFVLGGWLASLVASLGLLSAAAFGAGFFLPALAVPILFLNSQEMSVWQWFSIGVPVIAVAFGLAGASGAASLGLSRRGICTVALSFLFGGALGAALFPIVPGVLVLVSGRAGAVAGSAVAWLVPWYIGGRAVGIALAGASSGRRHE